jgi:hypothetical protein
MASFSSPFTPLHEGSSSYCCFGNNRDYPSVAELAEEINELSIEEREKVFDDIHGVAKTQEETPEFVASCIQQLNKKLSAVPKKHQRALDQAWIRCIECIPTDQQVF